MNSLILATATRAIVPLLLLFSVFLLLRGHNEPGGGFVGGLVAASTFALYAFSQGMKEARQALFVDPTLLIGLGLALAVGSAFVSVYAGLPFMTGLWRDDPIPILGKLGTPFIFDVGVYFVVIGVVLTIIIPLAEDAEAD